jgi:hypothetical protein
MESMTEQEVLLMTKEATSWLLGLDASYHITSFCSQFRQYTARSFGPVRVRNLQHCAIISIGIIELDLPGGTIVHHDVRHVPELSRSLISVRELHEAGMRASFSIGGWTFHKGNLLLAHDLKIHALYPL